MPAQKTTCDLYSVQREGEYASIVVRGWFTQPYGSTVHGGELIVHGSFGTFGYTWNNCSKPFKEFLLTSRFDTLMRKLFGAKYEVFNLDATKKLFSAHLANLVLEGDITQQQAQTVQTTFDAELQGTAAFSQECFVAAITTTSEDDEVVAGLTEAQRELVFAEAVMLSGRVFNPQAVGFWNYIWPDLESTLRAEVQSKVQEVAHAA